MVPSRTQEHSYSRTRQQLPPSAPRIQTRPARSHDITRKGSHIDLRTGDWLRRRGHSLTRDKHVIPYRGLGVIGPEGNKVHIIEEREMGRGATFWQPASLAETAAGEALGQAAHAAVGQLRSRAAIVRLGGGVGGNRSLGSLLDFAWWWWRGEVPGSVVGGGEQQHAAPRRQRFHSPARGFSPARAVIGGRPPFRTPPTKAPGCVRVVCAAPWG